MKRKLRSLLTIGVLALGVGIGVCAFVLHARLKSWDSQETFEVHYIWDSGVKSLRIIDTRTGAEESNPKWRAKVTALAKSILPNMLRSEGLTRAYGRFYADTWGPDVLYKPVITMSSDPDFARDPDVTPLMSALDRGETGKARELIAGGVNVNASDQHGFTALMSAAALGDAATVQALLAAGAEVNARNKDGETALFPAAFLDRVAVARQLVEHGADVNAHSQLQITPLMEAASDSPLVVELLIRSGANVNARDVHGETALMMTASGGNADTIRALIRAAADVNAKDNWGRTALSKAADSHHSKVVQLLKEAGVRQ